MILSDRELVWERYKNNYPRRITNVCWCQDYLFITKYSSLPLLHNVRGPRAYTVIIVIHEVRLMATLHGGLLYYCPGGEFYTIFLIFSHIHEVFLQNVIIFQQIMYHFLPWLTIMGSFFLTIYLEFVGDNTG